VNAFHEHDPALSRTRPKRVARAGYLTNARWSRSGSSECFARIVPDLCMYVCPVEYIAALGFPAVESSRAWPAHRPREDGLTLQTLQKIQSCCCLGSARGFPNPFNLEESSRRRTTRTIPPP
jgi:hypothetical protein